MQIIKFLSSEETYFSGVILGKLLKAGDCIFLSGDLGAGKTTLAKGIAMGIGITEEITSPTFTILNYYEGNIPLCHFDLYRIETMEELECIGFTEYFYDTDNIKIIEWAEKFPDFIDKQGVLLQLEQSNGVCAVLVNAKDNRHAALMEEWIKNAVTGD